jgi:class 3 adenylate cyclase
MNSDDPLLYKDRFENLLRTAKKMTSCVSPADILESIRDEVKTTIPHAREACLIMIDSDAPNYTRPMHCTRQKDHINCHMCRRGSRAVQRVLTGPTGFQCMLTEEYKDVESEDSALFCEYALPIFDGSQPLAVLNIVADKGQVLDDRDMLLLTDLVELAANTIVSAKKYAEMAKEKLSLERILAHIQPFVPETVRKIIEKNPETPALEKHEIDVSVLFLDIADYTRISETLTQDKVSFIIEKYFSSFLDIIYSFEGDVNETAGDGLMAIFQGEEKQNALNAARAAMTIRRRTLEINQELERMFHPISVNMGLNSGRASVGMNRFHGASGTRMTFTASGPTTNLASRLASVAKDGDIFIGPETAGRIKEEELLFDRGRMQFKNIREIIHVYSLVPVAAIVDN